MYGLINQGVHDLAVQAGGDDLWREIKAAAGVDVEAFVGLHIYPDDITYRLVDAASAAMHISSAEVLHAFGKHWILYTARRGYGAIFDTMGRTLPAFLANLDMMHARLSLNMPEMQPPSFVCEQMDDHRIRLEYWSDRAGLAPMVVGLVEGLGEMYDVTVSVRQSIDRTDGADHDEFMIDYHPTTTARSDSAADDPLAAVAADV
jgi:hypothetical protein